MSGVASSNKRLRFEQLRFSPSLAPCADRSYTTTEDTGLTLRLERVDDELVVFLGGEMDLSTAPRLRDCFHAQLAEPLRTARVVIDLQDLDFIDSTGLSALLSAQDRVRDSGAELVLRSPGARVSRVLEMTGLDKAFTVEGQIPPT